MRMATLHDLPESLIADCYTHKQAAYYLGVSNATLRRWARQGQIGYFQIAGGSYHWYARTDLDALRKRFPDEHTSE